VQGQLCLLQALSQLVNLLLVHGPVGFLILGPGPPVLQQRRDAGPKSGAKAWIGPLEPGSGASMMADSRLGLVASVVSSSGTGPGAGPRREAGLGAAPGIAPGAEAGPRSDSVATCWPAAVVVFAWSEGTGRRVDESTSQAGHMPSNETAVTSCHRATLCLVLLGKWVGNGGNRGVQADCGHAHWACRILITWSHGHMHA